MRHLLVVRAVPAARTPVYAAAPISPVNVLDYGAVGDGAHDDTACDSARRSTPCRRMVPLYLPAGTYLVDT